MTNNRDTSSYAKKDGYSKVSTDGKKMRRDKIHRRSESKQNLVSNEPVGTSQTRLPPGQSIGASEHAADLGSIKSGAQTQTLKENRLNKSTVVQNTKNSLQATK